VGAFTSQEGDLLLFDIVLCNECLNLFTARNFSQSNITDSDQCIIILSLLRSTSELTVNTFYSTRILPSKKYKLSTVYSNYHANTHAIERHND